MIYHAKKIVINHALLYKAYMILSHFPYSRCYLFKLSNPTLMRFYNLSWYDILITGAVIFVCGIFCGYILVHLYREHIENRDLKKWEDENEEQH